MRPRPRALPTRENKTSRRPVFQSPANTAMTSKEADYLTRDRLARPFPLFSPRLISLAVQSETRSHLARKADASAHSAQENTGKSIQPVRLTSFTAKQRRHKVTKR
jgi:hypothetical protein